jgi:hypothetical protein
MNKIALRLGLIGALCVCAAPVFAGTATAGKGFVGKSSAPIEEQRSTFPFEFTLEGAYVGEGSVIREDRRIRLEEIHTLLRAVYTPRIAIGILRLGAEWERYAFDRPDPIGGTSTRLVPIFYPGPGPAPVLGPVFSSRPQIPGTLQGVNAIIGLDTQLAEGWLVRLELAPGLYGTNDLGGHTFNMPIVLGGTYIYSPELQFIFGVSVDWQRSYPVFPGGGIRWRFAPQWVLEASLPSPRLSYEVTQNLTLFAGAHLKGNSYRVSKNFGNIHGDPRLNKATVTYSELRTGGGVEWKISPEVRLSLEGGWMAHRQFNYHRADVRYRHDEGAPYGMVSLRAAF